MTPLPHGNSRDANEPEIVEAFKKCGAKVRRLDRAPFDLLVLFREVVRCVEVKTKGGRFTLAQQEFALDFPLYVVRSVEDVPDLIAEWSKSAIFSKGCR